MLHQNSVIAMNDDNTVLCLINRFVKIEYYELLEKIICHMAKDLSVITGLKKEDIIEDYAFKNDYNLIKEILQEEGQWDDSFDESRVMRIMKRKVKEN